MSTLTFTAEPHLYELDGVVVPSVTGILKASGLIDFSNIPPHILGAALDRGRIVHQAIHAYNEKDLDLAHFKRTFPDYCGYLDGWVSFCAQRNFTPIVNEYRVASLRHRVAGTIDCLGLLDGVAVLLDFATGKPDDVAKDLQTAAYHGLAVEWADYEDGLFRDFIHTNTIIRRFAVALRKDGTFRIEGYTDATDFRKFLVLVEAQRIVAARRGERVEVAA